MEYAHLTGRFYRVFRCKLSGYQQTVNQIPSGCKEILQCGSTRCLFSAHRLAGHSSMRLVLNICSRDAFRAEPSPRWHSMDFDKDLLPGRALSSSISHCHLRAATNLHWDQVLYSTHSLISQPCNNSCTPQHGSVKLCSALKLTLCSLDTGRLNPETYRLFDAVEKHYNIHIEYTFPDAQEVTDLVRAKGMFSFYEDGHQECCRVRKVALRRG